jgi:hypothetical protein
VSEPLARRAIVYAFAAAAALMPAEDRDLLRAAADRLAPPERCAPSEWAERNIKLESEQTARPGDFSPDVYPHQRDAMDVHWREPDKLGVIAVKPAQVGWTLIDLIDVAYCQRSDPGPELWIACDDLKAKEYCHERFEPLIRSSGNIARIVEEAGTDKKTVGYGVHFPGGKVTFAWATSEKRVIGTPFKRARIDDAEASFDAYPSHAGDLFVSVETRTGTYRGVRKITINGHPRLEESGLWALYQAKSDRRVWTIDCPHEECRRPVPMRWRLVRYGRAGAGGVFSAADSLAADGKPDPALACMVCPHCGRVISDAQRARALWAPRLGGTGRFESELEDVEARRRQYIGLHVTRLCDPRISVVELARQLAECGDDQAKILDVLNKVIGEPYSPKGQVVLSDLHMEELRSTARVAPGDVELLTVGVDVQKGPTGESGPPGLYVVGQAWTRGQASFIIDARLMVGWGALYEYLAGLHVRVPVADGGTVRLVPATWCAIDVGYLTAQCLSACRQSVYSSVPGSEGLRVQLAGVRYMTTVVGPDRPWAEAPTEKRIWKERPELGLVEYLYLHRHSWVDRTFRRFSEKRVRLLCDEPQAWREHHNANFQAPVRKQHDWEQPRLEWTKAKQARDDWARACDFGEAIAAIRGELDTLHLRGQAGFSVSGFEWGGAG